nr:hypothetical protein [Paraburkholderia sp. BCC1884]
MAHTPNPPHEPEHRADEDPGTRPTDVSKPIGDAIPTPVEPGLDQPLPQKGEDSVAADNPADEVLGDTDTPAGVPPPGRSDFA